METTKEKYNIDTLKKYTQYEIMEFAVDHVSKLAIYHTSNQSLSRITNKIIYFITRDRNLWSWDPKANTVELLGYDAMVTFKDTSGCDVRKSTKVIRQELMPQFGKVLEERRIELQRQEARRIYLANPDIYTEYGYVKDEHEVQIRRYIDAVLKYNKSNDLPPLELIHRVSIQICEEIGWRTDYPFRKTTPARSTYIKWLKELGMYKSVMAKQKRYERKKEEEQKLEEEKRLAESIKDLKAKRILSNVVSNNAHNKRKAEFLDKLNKPDPIPFVLVWGRAATGAGPNRKVRLSYDKNIERHYIPAVNKHISECLSVMSVDELVEVKYILTQCKLNRTEHLKLGLLESEVSKHIMEQQNYVQS